MATMKEGLPACFTEQTYVLTQPHSGRFCKTLSSTGTVVISSSQMDEGNNRALSPFADLFRDALDHAAGADMNGDGVTSWREVKEEVEQKGLQPDGSYDRSKAFKGHVPIVRCFHHVRGDNFTAKNIVLNLASGDYNVFRSDASGWGWHHE